MSSVRINGAEIGTFTTSADLAASISDESGTGVVVFNTSPTFVTPTLGVATGTRLGLGAAADATDKLTISSSTGSAIKVTTVAATALTVDGNFANVKLHNNNGNDIFNFTYENTEDSRWIGYSAGVGTVDLRALPSATSKLPNLTLTPGNNATALTLTGGSITGSGTTGFASLTQTWNTSGVIDGALRIAITDTASGASSLPFAIYGGASATTPLFKVAKDGTTTVAYTLKVTGAAGIEWAGSQTGYFYVNGTSGWFGFYDTNTASKGFYLDSNTSDGVATVRARGGGLGGVVASNFKATATTVASLPAAPSEGMRASVTDSNAVSFTAGIGAVVVGGGSTHVPVYYDGTNWRIG